MDPPETDLLAAIQGAMKVPDCVAALDALAEQHNSNRIIACFRLDECSLLRHAAMWRFFDVLGWVTDRGGATPDDCIACGNHIMSTAVLNGHIDVLNWLAARMRPQDLVDACIDEIMIADAALSEVAGGLEWMRARAIAGGVTADDWAVYEAAGWQEALARVIELGWCQPYIKKADRIAAHWVTEESLREACLVALQNVCRLSRAGSQWLAKRGLTRADFVDAGFEPPSPELN